MPLQDRILNLACHWQASNFDINREISEMQRSPQSSSFSSSRKRCPSPLALPPRPSAPLPLEIEVDEETKEPVEESPLTPLYQRRKRCVTKPWSTPSVDLDHPEYYSPSLAEFLPSRQVLETVWEVEIETEEVLETRVSNDLTDSRDDELLTPPDSPVGRERSVRSSSSYVDSKNDYSRNAEKFEEIMERMGQLHRETSELGWGEEELRGPQCNR